MYHNFAISVILTGSLLAPALAKAEITGISKLLPDQVRVMLKPGECGASVTGGQQMRWFCAGTHDLDTSRTELDTLNEHLRKVQADKKQCMTDSTVAEQRLLETRQNLTNAQDENQALLARMVSERTQMGQVREGAKVEKAQLMRRLSDTERKLAEANAMNKTIQSRLDGISGQVTLYRDLLGDSDRDGIVDMHDLCMDSATGQATDSTGCASGKDILLQGVAFAMDSTRLTAKSQRILDALAVKLNHHPDLLFDIAGHTDNIGSVEYNLQISALRANNVKKYLVSKGVSVTRLATHGHGQNQPIADNGTTAGRALNRRVALKQRH